MARVSRSHCGCHCCLKIVVADLDMVIMRTVSQPSGRNFVELRGGVTFSRCGGESDCITAQTAANG